MDDLSGLDWSNTSTSSSGKPAPVSSHTGANYSAFSTGSNFNALSGRSTPLSAQASGSYSRPSSTTGSKPPPKSATSGNDSFSGLVSFGSSRAVTSKLSLQEQAKRLQEEKQRKEQERRLKEEEQFGGKAGDTFWNNFGGATRTNAIPPPSAPVKQEESEEDILAAFSSAAPVDSSSYFSPSQDLGSEINTPDFTRRSGLAQENGRSELDEDIFGLGEISRPAAQPQSQQHQGTAGNDDEDVLGLLGKPVSELPSRPARESSPQLIARKSSPPSARADPRDQAIAELVDMGFPADKARQALAETDTGLNVQAAVGWLLNQAHEESRQKNRGRDSGINRHENTSGSESSRSANASQARREGAGKSSPLPPWMRSDSQSSSTPRRQDSRSPAQGEKDVAQYASEIGNQLFKSANSIWKTGTKKVQKAVAEFQQDFQHEGDPSQPKWMREARLEADLERRDRPERTVNGRQGGSGATSAQPKMTDEALMLENGGLRPQRHLSMQKEPRVDSKSMPPPRGPSPRWAETERSMSQSRHAQQYQPQLRNPRERLNRLDVEEQSAQAYISPARRKKATPKPAEPEMNIFSDSAPVQRTAPPLTKSNGQPNNPFRSESSKTVSKPSTPQPVRPKALPRNIPSVSPAALSTSASHRAKGTEAFKRGDYASAQISYSQALSPLPQSHPITIIILCNRALTYLKVGDPKAAVADADTVFSIIGPSRGENETIDLGPAEGQKPMKDYYGKALMRKAEALEQMEKWSEAGNVWREAVEAGVGGATSIQGRNRCEKAAGGGNSATSAAPRRPPQQVRKTAPVKTVPALHKRVGTSSPVPSAEAVARLRAANLAAEKADDEKFALTDAVDAKLTAWKAGKADNLRALLGSLDSVLWPEAGWKKVGMHELVMPQKVKITYMKGIAKVHPDKLPPTATTEQKMISAAVFSTLNEAWDKFKRENGL